MFLVSFAGSDEDPIPARQPATRHERKWMHDIHPIAHTQAAWIELNRKGLDIFRKRGMPEAIREIVKQVAASRRVAIMILASNSQMRIAVYARCEIMYKIKAHNPSTSSSQIGRWFDRDHTSVLHCIASHQDRNHLPPLVGYDIDRVRRRNREISEALRANAVQS